MSGRIVIVLVLSCCLSGWSSPVQSWAQDVCTLVSLAKRDDLSVTRFTLQFTRLPEEFRLITSGQRVEVILPKTVARSTIEFPPVDERLVNVLLGQDQTKLMLSLLLRRPPHFVNSVKDAQNKKLIIDVHWRDGQRGSRPAISRSLPGQMSVRDDGGVVSRAIASKYHGKWLEFFAEYERKVNFTVPMNYTLARFPCLSLVEDPYNYLPVEVVALVQKEDWDAALTALDHIGLDGAKGLTKARLLLVKADIKQRAGRNRGARRYLKRVQKILEEHDNPVDLVACLKLQQLYVEIGQAETPYELLAELVFIASSDYPLLIQQYLDLLQAEVAVAVGDIKQAQAVIDAASLQDIGSLEFYYRLRRADITYLRGNFTGALEQYRILDGDFADKPFSLAGYAISLYRTKQYPAAVKKIKELLLVLTEPEPRDMARYMMALALIHTGDSNGGYDLLHQITPGTAGAHLAKGKIADLSIQVDEFYSRRRAISDYAMLGSEMVSRGGRAEMQFKHALSLYILGQRLNAIDELELFLKSDRLSELIPYAQALLAELLPGVIHDLVQNEKYFKAMVLVEQNRDLLVATHREFKFLLELGQVFSQLEFTDNALRLYLYLLDVTNGKPENEEIFVPLLTTFTQQLAYGRVVKYANKYAAKYPKGASRAEVYLLKMQAMLAQGDEDGVVQELQLDGRPQSLLLNRMAAALALDKDMIDMAQLNMTAIVGNDYKAADPEDILLEAEILLRQGRDASALERYRYLNSSDNVSDQALYREATVLLKHGSRKKGLKLLRELVDKAKESQWRTLAQEMLRIEKFDF